MGPGQGASTPAEQQIPTLSLSHTQAHIDLFIEACLKQEAGGGGGGGGEAKPGGCIRTAIGKTLWCRKILCVGLWWGCLFLSIFELHALHGGGELGGASL